MRKTNGQGGITLIALVVTIVVLLILAGITIMYVFSNDGIFSTAQEAKMESVLGTVRDYVSNAQAQALMESYAPTTSATFDVERANFPSDAAPVVTSLTYDTAAHQYGGTVTGTLSGVDYTVTFTAGVAKVTGTAAE